MTETLTVRARWIRAQGTTLRRLDRLADRLAWTRAQPPHLQVGRRGELEALFGLRELGYTVVARRWTTGRLRGDVDLIGWERDWLCFVEVKTRSERDRTSPAEAAVDQEKRQMLRRMARAYLRSFPEPTRSAIPVRFDVVSVYLHPAGGRPELDLFRGAFGWV